MKISLDPGVVDRMLAGLSSAESARDRVLVARQPVHTVYGGAHLFRSDTALRLGALAAAHLERYAPDPFTFARSLGLVNADTLPSGPEARALLAALDADPGSQRAAHPAAWLAHAVYRRTQAKLQREAVEDLRIDFEDGYGLRPDAEEDAAAIASADALAEAMVQGTLPMMVGIRVKPIGGALQRRCVRTLDLFLTRLMERAARLPERFVITLPKVQRPEQVAAFASLLGELERCVGLAPGRLKIELMIETTDAFIDAQGGIALPLLLAAAQERCVGAHFGAYDFTADAGITAQDQQLDHPLCDLARHLMSLCYTRSGIALSDGATNVLPIGPHKGATSELSYEQEAENRRVVHAAWRTQYRHIRRSLSQGFYQGWDLHPGQIPVRYAACYAFFIEGQDAARDRLVRFVQQATRATRIGDVFDDAATGQGLLNFFSRALSCGALEFSEIEAMGFTRDEIERRSFLQILANRTEKTA